MFNSKILIVDDEKDISKLILMTLKSNGFNDILQVYDGKSALEIIEKENIDLILLDLMLPVVDGLSVCRILKQNPKTSSIPIIMISAKTQDYDIVLGLELGANDYITKPFSPEVLIARIRNQLRLKTQPLTTNKDIVSYKDLIVDKIKREVVLENKKINLTYSEFEILSLFIENLDRVYTRNQLLLNLKGIDAYDVSVRSIDVQILNLRRKLGEYGKYISSVRGVGYRFCDKAC